jgi:DNA (cytosine-5)-methyltransferase 1
MEETRGTLFFDILKILEVKRPEAFFLENVRGLLKHESPGGIKTLEVIKNKIASLGYHSDVYLVKASDYGVPQRRERIFIIGFKDKEKMEKFILPPKKDLIYSLDAVLGGTTNRTLGYTLRVGGRGSGLGDRRNWDTYLVNGNEKRIGPSEGLKLQGFPSWFRFPDGLPETQAMKQLGNSVAVPAIEAFANEIVRVIST